MTLKYKILSGLLGLMLLLIALIIYILQPSGKVQDFQPWLYQPAATAPAGYTVKFFGVSTLLFDDGQQQLLIDGFFSRPSLSQLMFGQINSQPIVIEHAIELHQLQRTQAILVTHSHYDHALDVPLLGQLLPQAKIIGSRSTLNIARGAHLPESQLQQLVPLQPMQIGNFTVTAFPSQHTPPTAVNNDLGEEIQQPLSLPARFSEFKEGHSFDYLIEYEGHKSLVKASTGFIPEQLKQLQVDHLFLGIAQLSKQPEQYQQQYLAETLQRLKPKVLIPIHWDDFFQPPEQPLQFLPHLADNTPKSLNTVIKAAAQQQTQVLLLDQPYAYQLMTATDVAR